jgi:hypothetical protein
MAASVKRTVATYVVLVAVLPSALFAASFAGLCAMECSALPWYSLVIGPALGLLVVIAIAVSTFIRAKRFEEHERRIVRAVVLSSILWAGPLASWTFGIILGEIQKIGSGHG